MPRIIFVNRFFYPDQSATSQILSDLLFNIRLKIEGELHVVTSRNTYEVGKRLPAYESVNGITVHRVWTSNFGRKTLPGRTIDYLTFYLSTFIRLMIIVRKDDVVVAKTDPPVISIVAWTVSRMKGARLINWIQDMFPEVAGALGVIKPSSLMYRVFKRIKNISIKAAVCNVVIGERMKDRLVDDGADRNKIQVIHNWNINQDERLISKQDNYLVTEWGLSDKFVIGYSGNFGRAHEYEPVRRLVEHFANDNKVTFLFIGGGKYYDDLMQYARIRGVANILFKPYQDKRLLSYSLSVADVHLISLVSDLEGLIVPSKFYGLASLALPVVFIGDPCGEIGRILKSSETGYVTPPDNIDGLIDLIAKLASGEVNTRTITRNMRIFYDNNYKPIVSYIKWECILTKVMGLRSPINEQ